MNNDAPDIDGEDDDLGAVDRWDAWLAAIQDDEVSGGGDLLTETELLATGLAQVESFAATLAQSEAGRRQTAVKILTRAVTRLSQETAAARQRHEAEIAALKLTNSELRAEINRQRSERAHEAEAWRDELKLLANELAEQRAVSRLRESRSGRAREAEVRLRLLRKELEREGSING
jgi:hypothetical protein